LQTSDSELVQKCLHGDNSAFDALVRRYQKQVFGLCCRMLGDDAEAADAAQESFIKAYNAMSSINKDRSFLSWMFRIANNCCIDFLRKRSRRKVVSFEDIEGNISDSGSTPERISMKKETARILQAALMHLPEKFRAPLVMFHFSEMKIKEISEILRKPEGTIKSDLHQAREMLRRRLEGVVIET